MKRFILFSLVLVFLTSAAPVEAAYDANVGRWMERDPLPNAERSQGPNLYEYVSNQPINLTDPSGLATNGGAEGHIIYGYGLTTVQCCDEAGNARIMLFEKHCVGLALGVGGGGGLVTGMEGSKCRPSSYEGWFAETGAGPFGVDVGFGGHGLTGVNDLNGGVFAGKKLITFCYYTLLSQIVVKGGCCNKTNVPRP